MKKNLQKKDLQLQSEFKIGDYVIPKFNSAFLSELSCYKISHTRKLNGNLYFYLEDNDLRGYNDHFFVKATELNKALL